MGMHSVCLHDLWRSACPTVGLNSVASQSQAGAIEREMDVPCQVEIGVMEDLE